MNILVTGSNGQLGNEMRIKAASGSHRFIFTDIVEQPGCETAILDICDREAVLEICRKEKIDLIVNCAAYTAVDKAEDDEDTALRINAGAPANLAGAAAATGAFLIHVSTDYVFPGNGCVPLKESDVPDPRSAYGRTKLAGEEAIRSLTDRYVIIRTAWLYSPFGNNFVKTMKRLTAEKDSIKVVYDQVGTPTYAADLASAIMKVIDFPGTRPCGVYHFSDEGAVSWYDFACSIAAMCGNVCDIRPCLSDEFPSKVARPHYSVLDKALIKSTFAIEIPYWTASLSDCLKRLK